MNEAKNNRLCIIGGAILILVFILLGDVFVNNIHYGDENIIEYSSINRAHMHPLDSLRFKML